MSRKKTNFSIENEDLGNICASIYGSFTDTNSLPEAFANLDTEGRCVTLEDLTSSKFTSNTSTTMKYIRNDWLTGDFAPLQNIFAKPVTNYYTGKYVIKNEEFLNKIGYVGTCPFPDRLSNISDNNKIEDISTLGKVYRGTYCNIFDQTADQIRLRLTSSGIQVDDYMTTPQWTTLPNSSNCRTIIIDMVGEGGTGTFYDFDLDRNGTGGGGGGFISLMIYMPEITYQDPFTGIHYELILSKTDLDYSKYGIPTDEHNCNIYRHSCKYNYSNRSDDKLDHQVAYAQKGGTPKGGAAVNRVEPLNGTYLPAFGQYVYTLSAHSGGKGSVSSSEPGGSVSITAGALNQATKYSGGKDIRTCGGGASAYGQGGSLINNPGIGGGGHGGYKSSNLITPDDIGIGPPQPGGHSMIRIYYEST